MEKGLESLKADVMKDCEAGEGCFNPAGCNHEFTCIVPQENPNLVKMGITTACKRVSKCTHQYCDTYKWVLERAEMYAKFAGVTKEEVIEAWEKDRHYWYMNYYQDCNQPLIIGGNVLTIHQWRAKLIERFGENPCDWKFVCPSCGHVQSGADFLAVGKDIQNAYCSCIGRFKEGTGCKWSINGLIALNKTTVLSEKFVPVKVFEMAEADVKQ
ncbi:VVA0879 family protein [Bacteroides sp.]|uniref:VVA0879 family protein n=1 Tax=Bacteroides sp. TaxID=29523 RepID=UPI0026159E71|nr:VVA0879 family protein [Bacteroides sp.]MDD3037936.1 hypothetical protein [Bacteroides sp.]